MQSHTGFRTPMHATKEGFSHDDHAQKASGGAAETVTLLGASHETLSKISELMVHDAAARLNEYKAWQADIRNIEQLLNDFIAAFEASIDAASNINIGEEKLSLEELNRLLTSTLHDSMDKTLFVSKHAVMMVYMMDDVMTSIMEVSRYIADIKAINRQANMLAVNASIEAVRAGMAGENFAVVAREIHKIAGDIKQLTSAMGESVRDVSGKVKDSYGLLETIATLDLEPCIASKDRMEALLSELLSQQLNASDSMKLTSHAPQELLERIRALAGSISGTCAQNSLLDEGLARLGEHNRDLRHFLEEQLIPTHHDTAPGAGE